MGLGGRRRQQAEPFERRPSPLGRRIRDGLAIFALIVILVTLTPITIWWADVLRGGPPDGATGKVMVVLASSGMDDLLGDGSYWRSTFALAESRAGNYERIVISGGGSGEQPAARPMKGYLVAAGINPAIIETEEKSISTHENSTFTADMLRGEKRPIALVTSEFHMFRSARLFEKAGITVLRRPYPDAVARATRWRLRWQIAYELAVETGKIAYYRMRGWI